MTSHSQSQQNNPEQLKAQVQDQFSRTAESYVASFSHRAGSDLDRLIELGEWNDSQQALDVATGGGHTALAVAPHVAHITVTDLTPRMLEKAREFLLAQGVTNAVFVEADAEHLPFPDTRFDRVTCRIAAHHFPHIQRFVNEVARVLVQGGLFLLIDCMAPSNPELDAFDNRVEKWRDPSHARSFTVEEWEAFLKQAGLAIEHREFFRKTHDFDDWTTRSQMPSEEKKQLARFILGSDQHIRDYFEVQAGPEGRLISWTNDFLLLKGRKR